jgi:N-acyl-D-amino-acid deacylase
MYDLLIKGGTVVDGTGGAEFTADVAVTDGRIVEVGRVSGAARRQVDADGLLVTPGFVDIHTHFDGQATWDPALAPSSYHGVSTVVMGNCGVGFAPLRPGGEAELIELMEGVEDIPGTTLAGGIDWRWETFGEYLDALGERQWMLDVATQVPHAALRAYVMGERAATGEPSADDLAEMADLARQGVRAGALGISTTRLLAHRTSTRGDVPGTFAEARELAALGGVLGELGTGVFEIVPRGMDGEISPEAHAELDLMGELARSIGRPVTFSLVQTHTEVDRYRLQLERAAQFRAEGVPLYPQVANRTTGILIGVESRHHAFSTRPSYREIAHLPALDRVRRMRNPEVKARILAEQNEWAPDQSFAHFLHETFDRMYEISDPIDWEPSTDDAIGPRARRAGRQRQELLYDIFTEGDGQNLVVFPYTNYSEGSLDAVHEMLTHPTSVFGLGDAGAHCGIACDGSSPTLMLEHWTRERKRGPLIPLPDAIRMMTSETAALYGMYDRGVIAPGYRADLNVIDHASARVLCPELIQDLPASGRRVMQRATGYHATVVAGVITLAHDEPTGENPGRLVRGQQSRPA